MASRLSPAEQRRRGAGSPGGRNRASAAPRRPDAGQGRARAGRPTEPKGGPACASEVAEGLLGCLRPLLEPAAGVRTVAEHKPDPCQSGVVFCLLEERQRRPRQPLELVDRRVVLELRAGVGGDDAGECLPALVAGLASPLGRLLGDRRCLARRSSARRRDRARDGHRAAAAGSTRAPARAAGRPLDLSARQRARRPAAARCSLARSASPGSGCPSSAW